MSKYDMSLSWQKLYYTVTYKNTDRYFWQFWKPKTVDLPVYEKFENGETIRVVYGQIGHQIIEESIDDVREL